MMLLCVFLLATPIFSAVCNLKKCENITSLQLERSNGQDLGSFNLTTGNVVVLSGRVKENCRLSLDCQSNKMGGVTNLTMSFLNKQAIMQLRPKSTDLSEVVLVNTTITSLPSYDTNINPIMIQFNLKDDVFASYSADIYHRNQSNYEPVQEQTDYRTIAKQLLKGEPLTTFQSEKLSRILSATDCGEDLTLSWCPCSEPVITDLHWNRETSILRCSAVSIGGNENLVMAWTEDGEPVTDNVTIEEHRTGELMKTSFLLNVTSTEESRQYTCTASLTSNGGLEDSRSKRIPANSEVDGKEGELKDEDESSQALLTIIICVVIGSMVVLFLLGFGILKLVGHFTKKNRPPSSSDRQEDAVEPTAGNSSNGELIVEEIIVEEQIIVAGERESGPNIESTYQDLEEIPEASEPSVSTGPGEAPVYAAVNPRTGTKPAEQKNIYNRLDPTLMAVNRGDPNRWRTPQPGEMGAPPQTMGAPQNRVILQPPAGRAPQVPGTLTTGNNFSPGPEEGHYEMQTLKL